MTKLIFSLVTLLGSFAAFAGDHATGGASSYLYSLIAASAITIAAVGGAFAQSKAASVTLEGIARNPSAQSKLFTPMIISLALIESLIIYVLVIAFIVVGK